ncbi:MAG: hypothetical protein PVJ51_05990, partial [Acidobacteriota bacterium]
MMEWLRSIDIQSFLNSGLDVGAAHVTVLSVLTGLTVVLFTLWLSRVLENAAERGLGLTKVVDPTSVAVTGRIVHYAVL